LRGHW